MIGPAAELPYLRSVLAAGAVAADALLAMEDAAEMLAPDRIGTLAESLDARSAASLARVRDALAAAPAPPEVAGFDAIFPPAFAHALEGVTFVAGVPRAPASGRIPRTLGALHHHARAQEGAALRYRELSDLSHTYPRSENAAILAWFDGLCTGTDA